MKRIHYSCEEMIASEKVRRKETRFDRVQAISSDGHVRELIALLTVLLTHFLAFAYLFSLSPAYYFFFSFFFFNSFVPMSQQMSSRTFRFRYSATGFSLLSLRCTLRERRKEKKEEEMRRKNNTFSTVL